ncbi:MAG: hypothetical protein E6293_07875 [Dialister sp.]|nr:hypothetical protein [Dialister sp.]
MNTILDNIYGLVVRPVKTLEDVTSGEKIKEGIIIWLFVILLMTLSSFKAGAGIVTQFIGTIILLGIFLLFHSAVTDYFSGLLGGRGTARGITAGFMCASLPYAFSVFFALLSQFGLEIINSIGMFAIVIWSFLLDILAIRSNYGFGNGKAFLIGISPFLISVFLIIALTILGVAAAVSGLGDIQQFEGLIDSI